MIHGAKIIAASSVSLLLLYYSVAWAVLRCSHDAGHSVDAVAVAEVDVTDKHLHEVSLNPAHLALECIGPNFHIETMGEASSSPHVGRLMLEVTRHVNDFLTLQARFGDAAIDLWLRAVFDRSRSLGFLIGLPPYLFLSVLRF